jgi:hypothetical protein
MNLFGHRSSRAEDRLETWIKETHRERVLSGQTEPTGPCPSEEFLRALARRSTTISLGDARVDHAATCPTCTNRLLLLGNEHRAQSRKLALALAGTACLILIAGLIAWSRYQIRPRTLSRALPVSKTVDLWNAGTFRGEQPGQLQSVVLPATPVHLTIILPRFSAPGQYLVAVTRDQNGNGPVAAGTSDAAVSDGQARLSVALDLRNAHAGRYYLSTTHEQDQAAYYYPLQIK